MIILVSIAIGATILVFLKKRQEEIVKPREEKIPRVISVEEPIDKLEDLEPDDGIEFT